MSVRRCLHALTIAIAALTLAASTASADTLVVANTNDAGPGSLRDTVGAAKTGDTVQVPAGTYTLAGQILILKSISITGAGARSTVLDGGKVSRIFGISSAASPGVTISGATLTHGETGFGGAIDTDARLTLNDDAIVDNTATVSGGGGIYSTAGLIMDRDLIAGNSAPQGSGGGIELVVTLNATSLIFDTTLAFNTAAGNGGGIDQSTAHGQTLFLSGDTFDGNVLTGAASAGGNLFSGPGATVTPFGSVFTNGVAPSAPDCSVATLLSAGYNVGQADDIACLAGGGVTTDTFVADAQLGSLRDNGGQTDTLMPAAGGPLVDHGNPASCTTFDQRGVSRPQGATCDVGAVERTRDASASVPAVSAITATSATLSATADPVLGGAVFSFAYGIGAPSGASTPAQPFLGGTDAQPVGAMLAGLTPATTYQVQLHVHAAIGDVSSAIVSFTTAPAGVAKAGAPRISGARLTHKRFRVSSHATAVSAATHKPKRPPLGTRFRFTLSASAKAQIAITHSAGGLRAGRRCLAPTAKLRRAHAKHCTRTLTNGTLTRKHLASGARSVPFTGRIGHRALKPGHYRATIAASNAAGKARTVRLAFTVTR